MPQLYDFRGRKPERGGGNVTDLAVSTSRDDTGLGWNHWITVDGGYARWNKDQIDI